MLTKRRRQTKIAYFSSFIKLCGARMLCFNIIIFIVPSTNMEIVKMAIVQILYIKLSNNVQCNANIPDRCRLLLLFYFFFLMYIEKVMNPKYCPEKVAKPIQMFIKTMNHNINVNQKAFLKSPVFKCIINYAISHGFECANQITMFVSYIQMTFNMKIFPVETTSDDFNSFPQW